MSKGNNFFIKYQNIVFIYILSLLFFAIDIATKALIISKGNVLFEKTIINNFFYLTLTKNTGAAFSLFPKATIFLIIVGILGILVINNILIKETLNKFKIVSYSFLIGGILGNLFDRIYNGYVIDFLDFRLFGYNFPIFNFADIFIVIGAFLLIIDLIRSDFFENRSKKRK